MQFSIIFDLNLMLGVYCLNLRQINSMLTNKYINLNS